MRALVLVMVLCVAAPAQATPAQATPASWRAAFDVWIGGLRLADLSVSVTPEPEGWRARAEIATRGLAAFFAPGDGVAEAGGPLGARGPDAGWFEAQGDFDGLLQRVAMRHAPEAAPAVEADPPLRVRAYDPAPETLRGALDPLAAAAAALSPRPVGAICDRTIPVFDSRRRFDLKLGPAARDGEFWRCDGLYVRVSGFKAKHMKLPDAPFALYWRERDGRAELVKATAPTPFGNAVALRR